MIRISRIKQKISTFETLLKQGIDALRSIRHSDVINKVIEQSHTESAKFIYENIENAVLFYSREELWKFALGNTTNDGLHLEFGVADGYSLNNIAPQKKSTQFYGFDSFEGLPESWYGTNGYLKGAFDRSGLLPEVPKNVELIAGWFEETLPKFLDKFQEKISFIHLDADIYSSTNYVLSLLNSRISTNTILVFDEYHGYPGWKNGEKKAWEEFVEVNKLNFEYIAFAQMQVAIKVI